jgi:hypothetical protein
MLTGWPARPVIHAAEAALEAVIITAAVTAGLALATALAYVAWRVHRLAPTGRGKPPGGNSRTATAELALSLGLGDVGYARVSSSTGMVRTPAVWRSYSAKPG